MVDVMWSPLTLRCEQSSWQKTRKARTRLPTWPIRDRAERVTSRSGVGAAIRSAVVAIRRQWRHSGAMPSIQIKDVPESAHAVLRLRAAAAHQSLQEYLRSRLIAEASQPTLDEVLDRAGGRSGGSVSLADAVKTVQGDRARR